MASISRTAESRAALPSQSNEQNYRGSFAIMTSLFFMWQIMAMLGESLVPPVQGYIADVTKNLQISLLVPLIAYAYVAFYGAERHKLGRTNIVNL